MKLETTLSDRLRWVVFIRIHWISRSCPDTVGHAVDISWLCGVMLTSWRRWTTLAMPGWQATRRTPCMAIPTRAGVISFWWNSMPRVSTCGRASAVVRAVTLLGPFRRTGCDFVFESVPWRKHMKSFRSSCEVHVLSQVEWHHNLNGPIFWVHLQARYHDILYSPHLAKYLVEVWAITLDFRL